MSTNGNGTATQRFGSFETLSQMASKNHILTYVRDAVSVPASRLTQPVGVLAIAHPAYPSPNILLRFSCADSTDGCIERNTVLVACSIITNNRRDGWLSRTVFNDPQQAIGDDMLTSGTLYFHLPNDVDAQQMTPQASSTRTSAYAIIPTFMHWPFPHSLPLPPPWDNFRFQQPSFAERSDIPRCRLSRRARPLERVHIIPANSAREGAWFDRENMSVYGRDASGPVVPSVSDVLNGPANVIALRHDVHYLFDSNYLVFLPSPSNIQATTESSHAEEEVVVAREGGGDLPGAISEPTRMQRVVAAHAWKGDEENIGDWHRRPLMGAQGGLEVAPQYLFARFAWTSFGMLRDFLQTPHDKQLLLIQADGTQQSILVDAKQCRLLARPRSSSSRIWPQNESSHTQEEVMDVDNLFRRKRAWRDFRDSAYDSDHSSDEEDHNLRGRSLYRDSGLEIVM